MQLKSCKNYLFLGFVSPLCLALFNQPVYLFPAGILICSGLQNIPTLVYSSLFLLGLFLVNQLVKRLGIRQGDHFSSLLLGLDRDLFGLSGHLESSPYQLYSNLFLQHLMVSFTRPHFIYMGYYLYDHFINKLLEFAGGKLALSFSCSV